MGTREGREKGGVSRKRKGGVALAMEGVAHLEDRLGMKCWQGRPGRESWYLLDLLIHLFHVPIVFQSKGANILL